MALKQPETESTGATIYAVTGTVFGGKRAGVGGLRVVVTDRNVGRDDVPMGEGMTDDRGRFAVRFAADRFHGKEKPDLQAKVYRADNEKTPLGISVVRYDATPNEVLDVRLAPDADAQLPSEHETLTGAIHRHYQGDLRDLKEEGDRADVTYLANKTGWDARAVAMSALAAQFAAHASQTIPAPFYYALFRAGLPASEDTLFRADVSTVESVWKQAMEQGVIPRTLARRIPTALAAFQQRTGEKLLDSPASAGVSTVKEMLTVSGLEAAQQQTFVNLYAAHQTDMAKFWDAVGEKFGDATTKRLRIDGKLSFLTINNAPLVEKLHGNLSRTEIADPIELAYSGLYAKEAWAKILSADVPVPLEIPGDNAKAKRDNYAQYLAAQVRLSYPTASVAQMALSGALKVDGADAVHTFLVEHQGKFEIGVQPIDQYLQKNQIQAAKETVTQIKRVQRVYQLTTSDEAMMGLLNSGTDAAYHIVQEEKSAFVEKRQQDVGGAEAAAQIYDRAVQIHNVALNVAVGYLTARNGIGLGIADASAEPAVGEAGGLFVAPAPKGSAAASVQSVAAAISAGGGAGGGAANAADIVAYGTLEDLFHNLDFCDCPECRSILSPAAYLVDLLEFVNVTEPGRLGGKLNPQTVLFNRRPDLQHLPLTCENTNTALPYIDVVNETMEYFVANAAPNPPLSLDGYVGHDTEDADSADLLASPQYVNDTAYATLAAANFPPPLPFHQPLETLRRCFRKFDVPLPDAMETLIALPTLARTPNDFGWGDVWMETLRLSRAEYRVLTNEPVTAGQIALTLNEAYGLPAADPAPLTTLSNAKSLSRRLDISYADLIDVLKTRFINPESALIPKLERLTVSFAALDLLQQTPQAITDAAFDALLPAHPGATAIDVTEYGATNAEWETGGEIYAPLIRRWLNANGIFSRISSLIVLADTSVPASNDLYYDSCNFDDFELRHLAPVAGAADTRLLEADFIRILRFVRLWKKMQIEFGWNMAQTDAALTALYEDAATAPAEGIAPLDEAHLGSVSDLDAGFSRLLPRLGIVVRVMNALNLTAKRDLLPLLTCWADIGTHGDAALYRQLFLNRSALQRDDVFQDNGYGAFLTGGATLVDHAPAVRAALNLTGDEYSQITAALGYNSATVLNLASLSALYRRGWLARKLKISVRELLTLTSLTGLNPFTAPDPANPAILRLLELIQGLRDRSLKFSAALSLVWNQDISGKIAPSAASLAEFARTLRGDFAAIDDEFAAREDPDGDIARARVTQVYGQETADAFFALLDDTILVDTPYTHGANALEAPITLADPALIYDRFRHRLSRTGLMTATRQGALNALPGTTAAFHAAVTALFNRSEAARGAFFTLRPELEPLYAAFIASVETPAVKRANLLAGIDPELARRRKRQQALQRLSAAGGVSVDFAQTLLYAPTMPLPAPLHADGDATKPALADALNLETAGLSAHIFYGPAATGPGATLDSQANLDYAPLVAGLGNALPPNAIVAGDPITLRLTGQIEIPDTAFYNFLIEEDAGATAPAATVTLTLDGANQTLTQNGTLWRNADPIELTAGTLHDIVLTAANIRRTLRVQWETPQRAREVIPGRFLYPTDVLAPFSATYLRFLKASALASALALTAGEIARPRLAGQSWLNALPVVASAANPTLLFAPLRDALDYARIKNDLSPALLNAPENALLDALNAPTAAPDGPLLSLTGWDAPSLTDAAVRFARPDVGAAAVARLSDFSLFRRVYDALTLARKMGLPAAALFAATTNEPDAAIVRDFQAALRARYAADDWRQVIQPIHDEMRSLQRDALIAYILQQFRISPDPATRNIDTANKLFEFFLMDVLMEPCMQTSRIRHALSSVQLFIERCLMNIEARVAPKALNGSRWEWMKRYRVWEANRKIFLYPENWAEPELRDDKSPFFKEIESELLQSDITEDSATAAFLNYLSKLEDVAKLEPCGLFHVPKDDAAKTGEVDHVIARTHGAKRAYYYRRYEYGYWTPWEAIKLEIEDNPVVPVVWNDRLLLFWLRILQKPPLKGPETTLATGVPDSPLSGLHLSEIKKDAAGKAGNMQNSVEAILCWSEYYNGKWQPAKTSDVLHPAVISLHSLDGPAAFDRAALRLWVKPINDDGTLWVNVGDRYFAAATSFHFYNTHSLPAISGTEPVTAGSGGVGVVAVDKRFLDKEGAAKTTGTDTTLDIGYNRHFIPGGAMNFETWADDPTQHLTRTPLRQTRQFSLAEHSNPLDNPFDAPFFFADSRHVFFVTTQETPVLVPEFHYGTALGPKDPPLTKIPELIFEEDQRLNIGPKYWGDGGPGDPGNIITAAGVIDIAPVERFVTEDAYIQRAIGMVSNVSFGEKTFGPGGAVGARDVSRNGAR